MSDMVITAGIEYEKGGLSEGNRDLDQFVESSDDASKAAEEAARSASKSERAVADSGDAARAAGKDYASMADDVDASTKAFKDNEDAAKGAGDGLGDAGDKASRVKELFGGLSEGFDSSSLSADALLDGPIKGLATEGLPGLTGGLGDALKGSFSLEGGLGGLLKTAGLSNPALIALGLSAAAVFAGFVAGAKGAIDLDGALNAVNAKFEVTEAQAEALGEVGREVFANNWFDSIEQASVAAGGLRAVVGDIGSDNLAELTQQAAALEQVFDIPIEDTERLLQGMKAFEIQGQRSLDLVALAIQQTGDPADDLLDTFHEYGGQFEQLGFSAEDMTATLVSGLDAGAINADKVGDAVKEFGLRLDAGSDGTREKLAALDESLADLPDRFKAGEVTGKQAFEEVQAAMIAADGALPEDFLAEVFGGPGEDVTAGVITQLQTVGSELENIDGRALAAGDAINNNLSSAAAGLQRQFADTFIDVARPFITELKGPVIGALNGITERLRIIKDSDTFEVLAATASGLAKILGFLLDLVFQIIGAFVDLAGVIGGGVFEVLSGGVLSAARALGALPPEADEATDALLATGEAGDAAAEGVERAGSSAEKSASTYEKLAARMAEGSEKASALAQDLLKAAESGEITEEELASLSERLKSVAADLGSDFASFGIELDLETIGDPAALQEAISSAFTTGFEARQSEFRALLEGEQKFVEDRANLTRDNAKRLLDVEKQNAEAIGKAREKNDGEALAKAEEAAKERLEIVRKENDDRLRTLRDGFAAEQEARKTAIAQASVDQTLELVRLGEISKEQAELIFGSLEDAFPGAEIFDPTLQATLEFEDALGNAFRGGADEAIALNEAARGIDASLDASAAAAAEAEAELGANFRAIRAEADAVSEAEIIPDYEGAISESRAFSEEQLAIDEGLITSSETRAGATEESLARENEVREEGLEVSRGVSDEQLALDQGLSESNATLADQIEEGVSRSGDAVVDFATKAFNASGEVVESNAAISSSADETAAAVEAAGGRLSGSYANAAAEFSGQSADIAAAYEAASDSIVGGQRDALAAIESTNPAIERQARSAEELQAASEAAKAARVQGEEDASEAAQSGASDTEDALSTVQDSLDETSRLVEDYSALLDEVPPIITTTWTFPGLEQGIADVQQLTSDIQDAIDTGATTIELGLEIVPLTPGAEPGESIRLQHDIEDAIAAAEPGAVLPFSVQTDQGGDALLNGEFALAVAELAGEIDELGDTGSSVAELNDEMSELLDNLDDAQSRSARARQELEDFGGTVNTILGFLDADASETGFGRLLALFDSTRLDESGDAFQKLLREGDQASADLARSLLQGFDLDELIAGAGLGVGSLAELDQKLRDLSDAPEAQLELWNQVVDVFENDLAGEIADYRELLDELDNRKDIPGGVSSVITEEFKRLHPVLEDIISTLGIMGNETDRQANTLKRLVDLAKDAAAEEKRALKEAQDFIKDRQKALIDEQKRIHDQRSRDLDEFQRQQEEQFQRELEFLDERKAVVQEQIDRLESAHQRRLEQLDAEKQAVLDQLSPFDEEIEEIEERVRRLKLAELEGLEESAEEAVESITELQALINAIEKGNVSRDRFDLSNRITLSDEERAELQSAIDSGRIEELIASGDLSDRARKLAERAAGGARLRPDQVLGLLQAIQETEKESGSEAESAIEQEEKRLEILRLRRQIKQDELDDELEGIERRRQLEEDEFEDQKSFFSDRLRQLDEERSRTQQNFDDFKEAVARAKDLERDRHEARIDQINREHALELQKLGLTEQEIQKLIQEQQDAADRIAAQAGERLRRQLEEIERERERLLEERRRLREEARRAEGELVPLPPATSPITPTEPFPGEPGGPGDPGIPGPIPPPGPPGGFGADSFGFGTDTDGLGGPGDGGSLIPLEVPDAVLARLSQVRDRVAETQELIREFQDSVIGDILSGNASIEINDNRIDIGTVEVRPDDTFDTLLDPRRRR